MDAFIVGTDSEVSQDSNSSILFLRSRRLYKSLSLLLAQQSRVAAPASLLLLALRRDLINQFAERWGLPLMMRMDYKSRPRTKPIGGIALSKLETILSISEELLSRDCLPLFHPNFDRFKDVYSLGAIVAEEGNVADVEIVGKGFDAGDLRLGQAIPHESLKVDLITGEVKREHVISSDVYSRERSKRATRIRRLKAYTKYLNTTGRLIDINSIDPDAPQALEAGQLPNEYRNMPANLLADLVIVLRNVKSQVLPGLPKSKTYVASLSYLEKHGWMFWDVYGEWYQR